MGLDEILAQRGVIEREHFDRETAESLERLVSRLAAIDRYRMARKYVFGHVVDAACGCGFGTAMLRKCPAVKRVTGYDLDLDSIEFARSEYGVCEYGSDFRALDLETIAFANDISLVDPDCVVSIETIEHLRDPAAFVAAVLASGASRFVVTFPSYPTSGFNKYHLNDITLDEMTSLVERRPTRTVLIDDAVWLAVYDL